MKADTLTFTSQQFRVPLSPGVEKSEGGRRTKTVLVANKHFSWCQYCFCAPKISVKEVATI